MKKVMTYAVVDLETTGTKMDGTNRIIQFSCVLVQNHQIVNTFNTLINPLMEIPADVQKLTGIKVKDVRHAPLFADVAGTIYALLQNTVFVAHNIQFDYRFLNEEFERVGYPKLSLKGIDTVQLSQILYPCLSSYRLQDLSTSLNITHDHPHQADSDATVTAKLLIKLLDQIKQLPQKLLVQLNSMAGALLFDTQMCFQKELKRRKHAETVVNDDSLITIGKITLKKPVKKEKTTTKFSKDNLIDQWPAHFEKRSVQFKLMEDVDDELHLNERNAFFEAPTGTGKTLGYLLPAAFETQFGRRFLISTTTNALQNQLIDHDIAQVNQLLPFETNVVSLKGSQHYIDLDKFSRTLNQVQNDFTTLVQMRILVWLAITSTGDLDELNLTVHQLPLFDEITHHGLKGLNQESDYYDVDFLRRRLEQTENADFIITNHAYLLKHATEFKNAHRTLIVDEAQQIIPTTLQNNNQVIDFDEIKIICDTLLVKMESQSSYSFAELVQQGLLTKEKVRKIIHQIRIIDSEIPLFRTRLFQRFIKVQSVAQITQVPVSFKRIFGFMKENVNQWRKIQRAIESLEHEIPYLYRHFVTLIDEQRLDHLSFHLFKTFFKLTNEVIQKTKQWQHLSLDLLEEEKNDILMWLSYPQKQDGAHLRLHIGLLEASDFLKNTVYSNFDQILFFSGNHFTQATYQYFIGQLGVNKNINHYIYESVFDYAHHSKALILKDAPDVNQVDSDIYCQKMSSLIVDICHAQQKQTMVLFNSNETLERVYQLLQDQGELSSWQILAQNVTGTAEKLKKRFQADTPMPQLLLATGSFWEGIDFPEKQLETLVITKLPFQAFQTPFNQIRYHRIEQEGGNAFQDIALPEAVMKFGQGVGRLIRTQRDQGLVITLDSRLVTRSYGKDFKAAFPTGMPLEEITMQNLAGGIKNFLNPNCK